MGNILTYSGIVTKLRAMEARLLDDEQFEEIYTIRSVPELASYLIEHSSYQNVLENMDPAMLHRGNIEKVLILSLYEDYMKIYRFCGLEQRKFLKLYLKRYEVDLINYCLRIVINHYQEPFDLNNKKPFFDKYSQLSIEKLITSRTTDQLIDNLKGTEYYEPLRKLRDARAVNLFDYDLALNLYYFTAMWQSRRKLLHKKELELFTRDCGSKIDLLNIQWIYRSKKHFQLAPADIYSLLIPIHYRISTDEIKAMVESATMEELYAVLLKTPYVKQTGQIDQKEHLTPEQMYADCLYHLYTVDRRRNPYSIASINTYLFLKEEELKKLTTAMECIRYGLTPGETSGYVGGRTT